MAGDSPFSFSIFIPMLEELEAFAVRDWCSYVQTTLDAVGLGDFIKQDKPCPAGGDPEQIAKWREDRAKAVYLIKSSLQIVWGELVDECYLDNFEDNPCTIYEAIISEFRGDWM